MNNHVLFEIGIEELPARFINDAEKQLRDKTVAWLNEEHVSFQSVTIYSTPRRLAVIIHDIADSQEVVKEEVRGPQVKIAKENDGNWSKAAIGFVKGQGKTVEDIYTKEVNGNDYIFVEKVSEAKKTAEILPSFSEIIHALHFPQTMRWGSGTFRFARPIRWLVGLYNHDIISFEVANVVSNNITRGHRYLGKEVSITDPLQYEALLKENFVIVDPEKRKEMIVEQLHEIENEEKFSIAIEPDLLEEVNNLVEYPTAFHGKFEESYLHIPEEVLITSMKEHQRYFPVKDKTTNKLLPYFVSVRNGDNHALANVIKGNEKVLRARLSDGAFFYEEDRKHSISFFMEKLKTVVFQEKIGTIYEKTEKIQLLATYLADYLQLTNEEKQDAERAAAISKFDLVTDMVNEFPELQGIMGEKYARHYGENERVATAIREHYLPTSAGGDLPVTKIGALVSIADKLDTIVSCISVGLTPTSSQDPLGLRRQAIGILRVILHEKWNIEVEQLIDKACALYEATSENVRDEIIQFFKNRAAYILQEEKVETDIIQAVLADGIGNLFIKIQKAKLLSNKRNDSSFKQVEESFTRVMNLGKKYSFTQIDEALFETNSEKELYKVYQEVEQLFIKQMNEHDVQEALTTLTKLALPIDTFFEENMVMADDEKVKENRLALMHMISNLIIQFADMTLIEWKQQK